MPAPEIPLLILAAAGNLMSAIAVLALIGLGGR